VGGSYSHVARGINGRELGAAERRRRARAVAEHEAASGQRQREGDTALRGLSGCCCPSGSWPGCLAEAATWQQVHAMWQRASSRHARDGMARRTCGRRQSNGQRLRAQRLVRSSEPWPSRRQSSGQLAAGGAGVGVDGTAPNGGPALARAWRVQQWLAGSGRHGAARNRASGRRAGAADACGGKDWGEKPARG
jgi:hypothetical protein